MKNVYKLACMARDEYVPAWCIYKTEVTSKIQAKRLYDEYSRKGFVQGLILKNMSTGEVLKAEITGNVSCGHRTARPLVLKK